MKEGFTGYYSSPLGILKISYSANGLTAVEFSEEIPPSTGNDLFLQPYFTQLDSYFSGTLREFKLKLDLKGTGFQLRVWDFLLTIPYGQTISYQEVAKQLGNPGLLRAVGHANGKNPIAIIVPCHRVVGSDGSLTGYAGGLWRKKWLLEHERKYKQLKLF
jgi:methylated-DNA-[protein]-cysteine S-methyltransferase